MKEESKILTIPSIISQNDKEIIVMSTEKGIPADEVSTNVLKNILKNDFKLEKTEESEALLRTVIAKLRTIIIEWVKQTAIKKKEPPEIIEKAGGELYTSGSYRLGVHGSSSDIDALCVVPRFVDRKDHFFGDLYESLKKHTDIKELRAIPEAHVPIIKMKFQNVDIDLLFARLSLETIGPALSLHDDNIFKGCDKESIDSLNAWRNNDMIISLVPNKENFRVTLKCVKVWAKSRDLYSNKAGYLGGISWAILVAKICQLFPNLPPNKLLEKFFYVFSRWDYKYPVLICEIRDPKTTAPISSLPQNWNPKSIDSLDQKLMPIITPAYPCINSTFNVSNTTKKILVKEMARAAKIVLKINRKLPGYNWMSLFKKYDFFKEYYNYLKIDTLANDQEDHLLWEGFIESRLRFLILQTEIPQFCTGIENLRPFTKPFVLKDNQYKFCTSFLLGFKIMKDNNGKQEADIKDAIASFCMKIIKSPLAIEKQLDLKITHITRDKLPIEVFENNIRPKYIRPLLTKDKIDKIIDTKNKLIEKQITKKDEELISKILRDKLYEDESLIPKKKGKYE